MVQRGDVGTDRIEAYICRKRVWEVRGDTEMNEGRGPMYTVGYFVDEDVARRAGHGKCAMGTDAKPQARTFDVVVFKDDEGNERVGIIKEFITLDYEDPEEVRQRALAKLTDSERRVLGLK